MYNKTFRQLFVVIFAVGLICGCKKEAPGLPADLKAPACAQNLQIVAQGKKLWADANHKGADDVPTMDELITFVRHAPTCPSGGTYTLGKVSEPPTCSIAEHNEAYKKLLANPAP